MRVLEQKNVCIGLILGYYLPAFQCNIVRYLGVLVVVLEYFLCHYVILFVKMSYICIV